MADVFISHSSKDQFIAERLAAQIRSFNLSVFVDSISINPGEDWTRKIHANLNTTPVMILLASQNAVASPTVNQEVGWAMSKGCTIIPILWDMMPETLPHWIGRKQALVLTGKPEAEVRQQLTELLQRLADAKKQRELGLIAIVGFALLAIFAK